MGTTNAASAEMTASSSSQTTTHQPPPPQLLKSGAKSSSPKPLGMRGLRAVKKELNFGSGKEVKKETTIAQPTSAAQSTISIESGSKLLMNAVAPPVAKKPKIADDENETVTAERDQNESADGAGKIAKNIGVETEPTEQNKNYESDDEDVEKQTDENQGEQSAGNLVAVKKKTKLSDMQ